MHNSHRDNASCGVEDRSTTVNSGTSFRFGKVEVKLATREVFANGKTSQLSSRAFDLLVALIERRDRVVTKDELLNIVWPNLVVEENNLQVHISSLRRLLGREVIATVPGRGYRFTAALEDASVGTNATGARPTPTPASSDAAAVVLTNLPVELPPLYGRAEDLSALRSLIESHKLVSIVGAGGIGKTALALALAHQLRRSFDDGVWLIELAPLADASLVAPTVAGVLGVMLDADAPMETLAKALKSSRMLIVLDNCEHLLFAVAKLAVALHRGAANVQLLATSQEPLKVAQEYVYRLGALALPNSAGIDNARQAGAVALFEARVQEAQPRFALSERNLTAVVDICRHLDGIALAIELAAARVPLLGVDGLRTRLDERFRVLSGGARLALPRHQTLRAALDWSHGLLTQDEQTVFRRLGVFAGSFGLASAQRVAADDSIDQWAVLDHLGALVDKSLVVVETGAEPRYRLLETSRAFALEKQQEVGEFEAVLRKHAEAVLAVFEDSLKDEYVLPTEARLERYVADLDNARAALEWASGASGDRLLHLALAGAVAWIWVNADLQPEGRRRTKLAMDRIQADTPPHLEARLLGSWSLLAYPQAGSQELAADARAVELYRSLQDRQALFAALCQQSRTQVICRRLGAAELALQEAEQIVGTSWPPALRAPFLFARACLLESQGRFEEAIGVEGELVQLASALDDRLTVLGALIHLEQIAAALGRWEESVARGRDLMSRIRHERFPRSWIESIVRGNLSMSLIRLGQTDEALEMARSAYPLVEQTGNVLALLDPLALLAFNRGRVGDAARILGRADMLYRLSNNQRFPVEQHHRDKLEISLQQALSTEELSRLMKEGETLSDEESARLALRE
jgi:predicted ATPase/DNA-binding winged helix-turn-helix (wHTH) protein